MCVCVCCDLALNLLQQSGRKNDRENAGKLKQLHSLHNFCKQSECEAAGRNREKERESEREREWGSGSIEERKAKAAKKRAKVRIKPRALRP